MAPFSLPFDPNMPGEILQAYREWIYLAVLLAFFISLAGVTLRKHFDRAYVKPLVVATGLMLTFGAFMARSWLVKLFDMAGSFGLMLLAFMLAFFCFSLMKGFGMPPARAFHATYVLTYLVAWVHMPSFFYHLNQIGLGIVNLVLVVMLFISAWQLIKSIRLAPGRYQQPSDLPPDSPVSLSMRKEEARQTDFEQKGIEKVAAPMTIVEFKSAEDILTALTDIRNELKKVGASLDPMQKNILRNLLGQIKDKAKLFQGNADKLLRVLGRMQVVDSRSLQALEKKRKASKGNSKDSLTEKLKLEQGRIVLDEAVRDLEKRLSHNLRDFRRAVDQAIKCLDRTSDVSVPLKHIQEAMSFCKNMLNILAGMKDLERNLVENLKKRKEQEMPYKQAA